MAKKKETRTETVIWLRPEPMAWRREGEDEWVAWTEQDRHYGDTGLTAWRNLCFHVKDMADVIKVVRNEKV